MARRSTTGIRARHARSCAAPGGSCTCAPSYEASVYLVRERRKIRKTFPTLAAARSWRADATVGVSKGTLRSPTRISLREAADAWTEGAEAGTIRTRSGETYKPSALRGYRQALRDHVLPDLGSHRLSEIRRRDVQALVDCLVARGLDASTVRNAVAPLRVVYRRAVEDEEVATNPTAGLRLPSVRGRRDRIASPEEAERLLAALSDEDAPIFAAAIYAGLRRGELQALRWEDVRLDEGVLQVSRSFDPKDGSYVETKTRAGRRAVPLAPTLREILRRHRLRSGRREGLVFGRSAVSPFDGRALDRRARTAWKNAEPPLRPIGLHECRHTFASLAIAAGVNAKSLSTYLGHASIVITLDRYGHLMPGNEEEAAGLLDAYLARAAEAAR